MLLASRGRDASLKRSIQTLYERASDPTSIELLLALDNDDPIGLKCWNESIKPYMDGLKYKYKVLQFPRLGYINLHHYNNKLAKHAKGEWFIIWNDDAVMTTNRWDKTVLNHNGQFKLLAFRTHRDHPYSIFPIIPRKWYDLLGYISPHPTQDGWLSQQAYMLDILERIDVHVIHDRYDLTGNNLDSTFNERKMLEGNPSDPNDFHHINMQALRTQDAWKIARYLQTELGQDISFFEGVMQGKQNPWEKLQKNDTHNQMVQFKNPHAHFAAQNIDNKESPKQ